MLYQNLCPTCGAKLQKVNDTQYACEYCGNTYATEKIEDYADKLSKLLDSAKLEMIASAKQNLYAAITAEYISENEVIKWCDEVKKYIPDDFQANFYDDFINKPKREVTQSIRKIDVKAHFELLESLIVFVAKSLEKSYVAALKDLIERAYKLYKSDMPKYVKYTTMVENEAEKLDKCMYDTKQPRKAFVAYSSKDSDKAIELVEVLESQGISCFISLRNLRHGVGSQENYASALKEAMDNCTSFVFVSSMNSRNIECDAYNIEIPYVRQKDFNNAPPRYRASNDYKNIPQEYKKPRVEYRIEESTTENYADYLVDEFFDGYERAYTLKDVTTRVMRQAIGFDASATEPQKEVKYCVACLSENDKNAQRCTECGGVKFAPDLNAVAQIRKQEKEEKLRLEEEKRRQEEERHKKEEEQKRKQEEEKRKRDAEAAKLRQEAEAARRKRKAERALVEETEKPRKKIKVIALLLILAIVLVGAIPFVPLLSNNKSDTPSDNTESVNAENKNTTNVDSATESIKNVTENRDTTDVDSTTEGTNNTVDNENTSNDIVTTSRVGEKITFGSYPQTKVTDATLTETLNGMSGTLPTSDNAQAWTSYEYYINDKESDFMWYIDIEEGGEKYRGVYFTSYRPYYATYDSSENDSNQDDNGYNISTVYWFKYEPISWTILSEDTANGTALILCDMIIDSQAYQNEYEYDINTGYSYNNSNGVPSGTYANNYAESTIRKWLNETVYNTAFSELQKQIILTTMVDNSATTTNALTNLYACENTEDKIFLLSYKDIINSNYGFSASNSAYDTVRQKKSTDYAQAQGVSMSASTDYAGNGRWWLRSPDSGNSYSACFVYCDGDARFASNVHCTSIGVVPALQIKLSELK